MTDMWKGSDVPTGSVTVPGELATRPPLPGTTKPDVGAGQTSPPMGANLPVDVMIAGADFGSRLRDVRARLDQLVDVYSEEKYQRGKAIGAIVFLPTLKAEMQLAGISPDSVAWFCLKRIEEALREGV